MMKYGSGGGARKFGGGRTGGRGCDEDVKTTWGVTMRCDIDGATGGGGDVGGEGKQNSRGGADGWTFLSSKPLKVSCRAKVISDLLVMSDKKLASLWSCSFLIASRVLNFTRSTNPRDTVQQRGRQ